VPGHHGSGQHRKKDNGSTNQSESRHVFSPSGPGNAEHQVCMKLPLRVVKRYLIQQRPHPPALRSRVLQPANLRPLPGSWTRRTTAEPRSRGFLLRHVWRTQCRHKASAGRHTLEGNRRQLAVKHTKLQRVTLNFQHLMLNVSLADRCNFALGTLRQGDRSLESRSMRRAWFSRHGRSSHGRHRSMRSKVDVQTTCAG
jgi:hypothetical protein